MISDRTFKALPCHLSGHRRSSAGPLYHEHRVHDGSKDITVNRYLYRELLKDSLDRIFEHKYDWMKDCVESKVFGIGLESYTVGSNDFYTSYAAKNNMMITP